MRLCQFPLTCEAYFEVKGGGSFQFGRVRFYAKAKRRINDK